MTPQDHHDRLEKLTARYLAEVTRPNEVDPAWDNGWYERFRHPVLTRDHIPLTWRYDLDPASNPFLLERLGVNAVFNAGAIEVDGEVCVMARIEGFDRKSFFGLAKSRSGIDNFRFTGEPVVIPETDDPDTNVYDMRLVKHEDGTFYGVFCTERKDPAAPPGDESSAIAQCGIVRSRDLQTWERLPDLQTGAKQQRNAVLHPEFIDGQYAFYTRPQDDFIEAGSGGGIGWGLSKAIDPAEIGAETTLSPRLYHTVTELKNGMGGPPLKTEEGWLHVAHGVRNTAAGMRYVLYAFLCDRQEPWRVIAAPGGYFIAPEGIERVGDVSNVVFSNGLVARDDGTVLIYYASSDTRLHVARTSVPVLLDYVKKTPPDGLRSAVCVEQRQELIRRNQAWLEGQRTGVAHVLREG